MEKGLGRRLGGWGTPPHFIFSRFLLPEEHHSDCDNRQDGEKNLENGHYASIDSG